MIQRSTVKSIVLIIKERNWWILIEILTKIESSKQELIWYGLTDLYSATMLSKSKAKTKQNKKCHGQTGVILLFQLNLRSMGEQKIL